MDLIGFCYVLALGSVIFLFVCGAIWVFEESGLFDDPDDEHYQPYYEEENNGYETDNR